MSIPGPVPGLYLRGDLFSRGCDFVTQALNLSVTLSLELREFSNVYKLNASAAKLFFADVLIAGLFSATRGLDNTSESQWGASD